ncbi:MAG: copper chaperone PCu(A)C [Gammaproteobacteria bacterium]|nr:copper chaperone PCu(A)C [Gammaproteobacteria bacterium]
MFRPFVMLLLIAFGVLSFAAQADAPGVSATHVWIRAATPDTNAETGYLILSNLSSQALKLVTISSPDFGSVEIRSSTPEAANLPPTSTLSIPAHGSLTFAPDNYYLILTKPVKHFYDGDLVTLMLTFSDNSSLTIMAPLRHDQPGTE